MLDPTPPPAPLVLDRRAHRTRLLTTLGQVVEVELLMLAASGFLWEREGEGIDVLAHEGLVLSTAPSGSSSAHGLSIGGPALVRYRFTASREGEEWLHLVHHRPFGTEEPTERFSLLVQVRRPPKAWGA